MTSMNTNATALAGAVASETDQACGSITPTIADPTPQAQPAELPRIAEARARDAAARAQLRTGRPDPAEAARLGLPGRSGR